MNFQYQITFVAWLLLSAGPSTGNPTDEGENVAFGKPIYAEASYKQCTINGKPLTVMVPEPSPDPIIIIDLLDVYNLTSIRVPAQKTYSIFTGYGSLNVPFSVHTWADFISPCDFAALYPWNLVKANLTVKRLGEEIVLKGPFEARYIIIWREPPSILENLVSAVHLGEVRAYGTKIRDGYRPDTFSSDPEPTEEEIQKSSESFESRLALGLKSWKYFNKVEFVHGFSENNVRTERVQKLIKDTVARYINLFKYYAPCYIHEYHKSHGIHVAFMNFNKILALQRGSRIEPAPGYYNSPGHVHYSAKPTSYNVTFKIDIAGSFFPMGGYAKPGEAFRYKVISNSKSNLNGFIIRMNPQVDSVGHKADLRRWASVTMSANMKPEDELVTPFGGPIVVQIPDNSEITIQFENVYRYPWFDIRNPDSEKNWEEQRRKYSTTPYLMVAGDDMISMLPTSDIAKLTGKQLKRSVDFFDNMIKLIHNYRGTSHEKARIEVFVTDDEISVGGSNRRVVGHSGYPWVSYKFWARSFANPDKLRRGGDCDIAHELGHNLQVEGMTFKNGGEVTNEMYVPMLYNYLLGISNFAEARIPGYREFDTRELMQDWKNPEYIGVKQIYYAFFGRYFGPALVGNVIHLVTSTKEPLNTEERKVNFWIKNMCNESGYDLVPFHRMWKFPIEQSTVEFCAKFPCWFPDDWITKQAQDLVNKFKGNCSSANPKEVAYKFDVMHGVNKVKPQSIFFPV